MNSMLNLSGNSLEEAYKVLEIDPSATNEESRRPLEERLYLLWGFPLEKFRAGSYPSY